MKCMSGFLLLLCLLVSLSSEGAASGGSALFPAIREGNLPGVQALIARDRRLVNRADSQKMQRIEKLIGYKVYIAPLPSFIEGMHDKSHGAHQPPRKSEKGIYKKRHDKNFRSRKPGNRKPA